MNETLRLINLLREDIIRLQARVAALERLSPGPRLGSKPPGAIAYGTRRGLAHSP